MHSTSFADSSAPPRVLYVESNPARRVQVASWLDRGELLVDVVEHPNEALTAFQNRRDEIDCIVTGYSLQGISGVKLLEVVRSEDDHLPVIMLAEFGSEQVASRAIAAGVTDYVRLDRDSPGTVQAPPTSTNSQAPETETETEPKTEADTEADTETETETTTEAEAATAEQDSRGEVGQAGTETGSDPAQQAGDPTGGAGGQRTDAEMADLLLDRIETAVADERRRQALTEERELFAAGPTVVVKLEPASGLPIRYISPNVTEMLGYDRETMLDEGARFRSVLEPDDIDQFESELIGAMADQKQHLEHEPVRVLRATGEQRWVQGWSSIVYRDGGTPSHIVTYFVDISRRKQVEAELEARTEAFETMHDLLTTTLQEKVAAATAAAGAPTADSLMSPDSGAAKTGALGAQLAGITRLIGDIETLHTVEVEPRSQTRHRLGPLLEEAWANATTAGPNTTLRSSVSTTSPDADPDREATGAAADRDTATTTETDEPGTDSPAQTPDGERRPHARVTTVDGELVVEDATADLQVRCDRAQTIRLFTELFENALVHGGRRRPPSAASDPQAGPDTLTLSDPTDDDSTESDIVSPEQVLSTSEADGAAEATATAETEADANAAADAADGGSQSPAPAPTPGSGSGSVSVSVSVYQTELGLAVEDDGAGFDEGGDISPETAMTQGVSTAADGSGLGLTIADRIAAEHGWGIHIDDSTRDVGTRVTVTGLSDAPSDTTGEPGDPHSTSAPTPIGTDSDDGTEADAEAEAGGDGEGEGGVDGRARPETEPGTDGEPVAEPSTDTPSDSPSLDLDLEGE